MLLKDLQYCPDGQMGLVDLKLDNPLNSRSRILTRTQSINTISGEELRRILLLMNAVLPIQILSNVESALNQNEFYDQLQYLRRSQLADLIAEELIRIGNLF